MKNAPPFGARGVVPSRLAQIRTGRRTRRTLARLVNHAPWRTPSELHPSKRRNGATRGESSPARPGATARGLGPIRDALEVVDAAPRAQAQVEADIDALGHVRGNHVTVCRLGQLGTEALPVPAAGAFLTP